MLPLVLLAAISGAKGGVVDTVKEQLDRVDIKEVKEAARDKFASFDTKGFTQAAKGIWTDVQAYKNSRKTGSVCDNNTCCKLGGSEQCALADMKEGESHMVMAPDGASAQCIYGTEYGFQVIPGSSEKLLFYFQGGGACWDRVSTIAGLCSTDLAPNAPEGVFDKSNEKNPFKDYTIIQVLYCSGDVHAGNVTQSYTFKGKPVVQHGIDNTKLVTNWLSNQGLGGDDGILEEFVVMGCSAGSVGAQIWADILLTQYPAKLTAVVPDSYVGLFPADTIGPYMKAFGMCDTELIPPDIRASCDAGNLDIQALVESHMNGVPNTPFAFIQSKVDAVQQSFYVAMGLTTKGASPVITPGKFYAGINGIFEMYSPIPNFISYLVDGPMHCFTNFNILYTTTNEGPYGKRRTDEPSEGDLSLVDWLSQVPLQQGQSINSECAGEVQDPPPYNVNNWKGAEVPRYSYCDPDVTPKTYTQA